ncbi:MAG: hypothetical protein HYU54_00790, partial [Actinobacteria bacterium]|nr:hypothetical protein [Actinomycetota bacterium]
MWSKRVFVTALVLGVLAAACSEPPVADVSFGSGKRFVPQVADFLDNVGVDPSVAVTPDGVPYIAYFGFPQELEPSEIAITRPIGAPSVPSVMLASVSDGIWTRGAVAMEKAIANVDVAFAPAEVAEVEGLGPATVTGTGMAVDAEGKLHVVWSTSAGLWYATNASGAFQATQVLGGLEAQLPGQVAGPSVAVDSSGMPWVSTYVGDEVFAGSQMGDRWEVRSIAAAQACPTCRTAIGVDGDGVPVVAFHAGGQPWVASPSGKRWEAQPIGDAGGQGLALATDQDGNPHVSYYAGTEVFQAQSIGGAGWQRAEVATVGSGSGEAVGAGTSIAVDGEGVSYVGWYDAATDSVGLASNGDGTFRPIPTADTSGGTSPAVSVAADGSAVHVAWYDHVNQDLVLGTYADVTGLALVRLSPAP